MSQNMLFRCPRVIVARPRGTGSAKFYYSGIRGVKKWPGPWGTGSSGFPVASLSVSVYNRDSSQQDLFKMTLLENNGNVSFRFYSGFFAYHLQNYLDDVRM